MAVKKLSEIASGGAVNNATDTVVAVRNGNTDVLVTLGGSGTTFDLIGSGTNTTATMVVGSGASLSVSGTGTILATNAVTFTATGEVTISTNGAASTPALLLSGSVFTGGSGTTTEPLVLIESPTATPVNSWSTAGTVYGINRGAGFVGNFQDFHINGATSVYSVDYTGLTTTIKLATNSINNANNSNNIFTFANGSSNALFASGATTPIFQFAGSTVSFPAIKRIATTAAFRLADDSGDASITAANTLFSGIVSSPSLSAHQSCRVATTGALTVTYNNGTSGVGATLTNAGTQVAIVIDGVTLSVADRVLVTNQVSTFQNGIYTVTNVGSGATNWVMTRATDFDGSPNGVIGFGADTAIVAGTANAGTVYIETAAGPFTMGTTGITFVQNAAASIVGGYAASVSNSDGTLTISPTTGAVVASLALGHANNWTALQTFSASGAASTPGVSITGTVFTGGSNTTTVPLIYINGGASAPSTWSTSGTQIGMNAVSGWAGNFLDFHTNGAASLFSVNSSGGITTAAALSVGTNATITGTFLLNNANAMVNFNADAFIRRTAAATLQLGTADAAAPVAQTLQVQSVVAGTSNTAGANWSIGGSKGTGTGVGGSIIFKVAPAGTTGTSQNALVTALTLDSTSTLTFAEAANIAFGTTTGTKIGTATSQKIGFYNATPIVQPTGDVATALSNLGLIATPTITATTNANLTGAVTSSGNATTLVDSLPFSAGSTTAVGNQTYLLISKAAFSGTINSVLAAQTTSGTITMAIKINGTNVTGLSAVAVTSTPADTNASAANTFATGDIITLVTSSASSDLGFGFNLKFTRT